MIRPAFTHGRTATFGLGFEVGQHVQTYTSGVTVYIGCRWFRFAVSRLALRQSRDYHRAARLHDLAHALVTPERFGSPRLIPPYVGEARTRIRIADLTRGGRITLVTGPGE